MQNIFDITLTSRRKLREFLDAHTLDQLNAIPQCFSNNLIWNAAHIVVVQQMLVYKLSGLPMMVSDEMVDRYKRGTRPDGPVGNAEVDLVKTLLFDTIDQTLQDSVAEKFTGYQEFITMSGYTIRNVQDAMAFNLYHEGVHTGMMMQIRKFV